MEVEAIDVMSSEKNTQSVKVNIIITNGVYRVNPSFDEKHMSHLFTRNRYHDVYEHTRFD